MELPKMPRKRPKEPKPLRITAESKTLMAAWHEINTCRHCDTSGALYRESPTEFHVRNPPEYIVQFVTVYVGELACRYCFRLQTEEGMYA